MPWTEVTKPPAVVWNMTLGYAPAGLELLFENSNAVSSFSPLLLNLILLCYHVCAE